MHLAPERVAGGAGRAQEREHDGQAGETDDGQHTDGDQGQEGNRFHFVPSGFSVSGANRFSTSAMPDRNAIRATFDGVIPIPNATARTRSSSSEGTRVVNVFWGFGVLLLAITATPYMNVRQRQ
jgi:hypothetical protein